MPNVTIFPASNNDPLDILESIFTPKVAAPLVLPDDPIALAFASYRVWKNTGVRWADLEKCPVFDEDRVDAENFRNYYRGRITWSLLKSKEKEPSAFRRKLYALVNGTLTLTKDETGMLYRLPYFYEEDQAMDEVVEATDTVREPKRHRATYNFRLLKRILRSRRAGDFHQFWLSAENSQEAFLLTVKGDNPLLSLLESIVQQPSFSLSAEVVPKYYMGFHRSKVYNNLALPKLA